VVEPMSVIGNSGEIGRRCGKDKDMYLSPLHSELSGPECNPGESRVYIQNFLKLEHDYPLTTSMTSRRSDNISSALLRVTRACSSSQSLSMPFSSLNLFFLLML
jgi:hypothetical protein